MGGPTPQAQWTWQGQGTWQGQDVPQAQSVLQGPGTPQAQSVLQGPGTPQAQQSALSWAAQGIADQVNKLVGGTSRVELRFRDFFDAVPRHHARGEAEDLFMCGTRSTTPSITQAVTEWPHPWLYSRVLLVLGIVFLGLVILSYAMSDPSSLPGLLFIGSMAVPFATVIFFFETNAPRDISIVEVVAIFFVGGVASILMSYPIDALFPGSGVGDVIPSLLTGLIEELAKISIVIVFLMRRNKRVYILGGILIGAAVGAGFDMFESAGYAFVNFLETFISSTYDELASAYMAGVGDAIQITLLRGVTTIGGHVAWAAIEGGAIALFRQDERLDFSYLAQPQLLGIFGITIVLHGVWDMDIPILDNLELFYMTPKTALLIAVAWIVLVVLMQQGLQQVNEEAMRHRNVAAPVGAPAGFGL